MARTLKLALDAAPGDQELVLGELAGLDERKPKTTSVSEFVSAIPNDLACGSPIWTQHGYVGGRDPVDDLLRALERKGCERPAIWITETGVGAPRSGEERGDVARRARARLRAPAPPAEPLVPRQTGDRRLPVHVPRGRPVPHRPDHDRPLEAYPALGEWRAWGGVERPNPTDPPPANACA